MADNTLVNSQITDAVTQTNVKVVAEAPAQAMAALYQVASHSAGLSLQNAVHSQQALKAKMTNKTTTSLRCASSPAAASTMAKAR